ncbi:hypothetical protein MCOR25_001972 [Pyricularia grisea]|uniref:Peptidase M14 domain-containing protein n=1 Tax=Pyricularia grisea TaxID=148305 RepID=A0A6P8APU8_PYRGI|nr:hypothetical protein PgNI_11143 [Pyricularia grisea]KAI6379384.1 hypothetical protein MCOR25_001972 [Pyricularia grisea]TLD04055.1 hypothetical protein PgNI_11143 [Pyricularia grisea]
MKSSMVSFFLFAVGLASAATLAPRQRGERVDYTSFKGLRVTLAEHSQELEDKIADLSAHILNPGSLTTLDIVVSPGNVDAVRALVNSTEVVVEDMGAALLEEGEVEEQMQLFDDGTSTVAAVPPESWFTAYHSYNDHLQFLRDLQGAFPSQSELVTAGASAAGRTIQGIHIWGSGGKGSKPAVLFHGTVHAREWITTMTTEYMAWNLLTKYSSDTSIRTLVDKFDFYIMPIVNPDGFLYTQTNDRLWRKNRQSRSGQSCVGTDNNRNWPYGWSKTGGASTSPCAETYKGLAAGDTPENTGLISQINTLRSGRGISLYIDFHSYGQYILWPYGDDCQRVDPAETRWQALATTARTAIRAVSGTTYTIGNSCRTLYMTTGDSTGYLAGTAGATYAYTYELRPGSGSGTSGFVLPAAQIQPTVRETFEGVKVMLQGA